MKDYRSYVPLLQEIAARTSSAQLFRRHGTGGVQYSLVGGAPNPRPMYADPIISDISSSEELGILLSRYSWIPTVNQVNSP